MAKQKNWRSRLPNEVASRLRQDSTSAEQRLWEELRDRKLNDANFRRQFRISETVYIADFCCLNAKLIIELDGAIHNQQIAADRLRQQVIEEQGYRVLRFSNETVQNDLQAVLNIILAALANANPQST